MHKGARESLPAGSRRKTTPYNVKCEREHRPQGSKCVPFADSVGMWLRLVMEILLRVRSRRAGDHLEGTVKEKPLLIQKQTNKQTHMKNRKKPINLTPQRD